MKMSVKLSLLRRENPQNQQQNTIIFKYKFEKHIYFLRSFVENIMNIVCYTNCVLLLDLKIVSLKFCGNAISINDLNFLFIDDRLPSMKRKFKLTKNSSRLLWNYVLYSGSS